MLIKSKNYKMFFFQLYEAMKFDSKDVKELHKVTNNNLQWFFKVTIDSCQVTNKPVIKRFSDHTT